MENELRCGWRFEKFSFLYDYFAYADTEKYLADNVFIKHKVRVWFMEEYAREGTEYRVIFCKCRKKDSAEFCAALEELPDKMLICGHRDYPDFCNEIKAMLENVLKKTRRKGGTGCGTADTAEQAKQESAESVS